ncbi:hypothetical protein JE945_002440 [Flavobacterium psychrophilum]|uniref:hypothetical protein n=1 Tax=Flavobacterium psychrophilum TaxID=96345 RepID=UPI000B7C3F68|nr:hypothetical protein [Flavobacterium psychrophilum]EKT4553251.1 hypothetical protein [Flavobacterium psychrophilum]SNB36682.1 conserved hypothetical protein [Flavobacterium psychrophilum]
MKKIILLLVIILNISCTDDKTEIGDGLPYFSFLQVDNDKFISSTEVGKILIYKNQNNAELKFKVLKNKTEKQLESRGTFVVGSYKYFYYDEQRIEMQSTLFADGDFCCSSSFYLSLKRWPKTYQTNPTVISQDSKFITNIGLIPFSTGVQSTFLDYSEPLISVTINTITYNKVRKIEITPNPFPNPNWQLPSLKSIYFDQNKGVIGFDDMQNNEWRIQN